MEEKIEKAVTSVSDALKTRKLSHEVEYLQEENERLQTELAAQKENDFEALLRATLLDPAGFIGRLRMKRIRLPIDGKPVDVDSLKVGGYKHLLIGYGQKNKRACGCVRMNRWRVKHRYTSKKVLKQLNHGKKVTIVMKKKKNENRNVYEL